MLEWDTICSILLLMVVVGNSLIFPPFKIICPGDETLMVLSIGYCLN